MLPSELVDDATWVRRSAISLAESWEGFVQGVGGRTARDGALWLADAASPTPFMNAVTLTAPLNESDIEPLTRRLDAFFAERPDGGNWLLWSGWPALDLERHGYGLWGHPPIMVREPGGEAPPPPPELRIKEARSAAELADIERAFIEGYPVLGAEASPPGSVFSPSLLGSRFRFYAGYVDDEVVAVSAALLCDEVTDVTFVATQPHARRRGYGTALTWRAALAEPSQPAVLEASDDGRPVYERMGFRLVGRMSVWERPRDPAHPVFSPYVQQP